MRALHKDYRTVTPQNFSNYESMKQDFKLEIPEYFNFAKDVLDQWTSMEKVCSKDQSDCSFLTESDFCPQGTFGNVWRHFCCCELGEGVC